MLPYQEVSMRRQAALWIIIMSAAAQAATEDEAREVLASRCWACHAQTAAGGLRLDSREAMLRGGKSGAAVVAGSAAQSRIIQAVSRNVPGVRPMPPASPLSSEEIRTLTSWVDGGAPWGEGGGHWSFQPLPRTQPGQTIDSFIREALQAKGLRENPQAGKRTLIRRLYFDLIGLPPTLEEFQEAFRDEHADWLERLVSKLLDSPHFGEKWGRHWLDVARYGEDDFSGTAVIPYANAWRYRDWVVQALNQDMAYDRFLMAQLAGDRMNDPSLLAATGLLGLGPWYYGIAQPAQSRADERHDRVDMVTRGMLGVTVACARCHDHKYDPFTAADYYALAGVFASTAYREYPLVSEAESNAWKKQKEELDAAEKALNKYLDEQSAALGERFGSEMAAYMMAVANGESSANLNGKVLERWKSYLAKPEENHPFLNRWFQGERTRAEAEGFQRLLLEIVAEKKALDGENRRLIEDGKKNEPKETRTIVLPGGYRSEEDFNPGAYIPSKSLPRDRFVAYNRTFGETAAPLKFDRELTAELLDAAPRTEYERLKKDYEDRKKALPPLYPYVQGAAEFDAQDLQLNIRGNPESLGEVIPRGFPLALSGGKPILFNEGSGRLQLADTVAHHPLAARVAVNRIWLALFGSGLVRTPSNFGRVGDRPALPAVLEFLAARFAERKYSVKGLIREIVSSEAYRRSSAGNSANEKTDPDNRYLWRQSRRRLEAEPLRDAMLAVSGELDLSVGGESKPLDAGFRRRTLYGKNSRFQQDETLSLFDLPAASVTCEQRVVTNVPLQKLFFLNSEIVTERSAALAKRFENPVADDGITAAYRLLLYREPSENERRLGREFLAASGGNPWQLYAQVLLSSNEFAYVD
jgi:cytochrome c553